jgi:hypothetical protein
VRAFLKPTVENDMRMTMKQLREENARLRAEIDALRQQALALPRRGNKIDFAARDALRAKFFEAHPGARSATPQEIAAWQARTL